VRRILPAFILLLLLLAFAAPALAHALLLRSDPEANAAVAQAPVQVQLWLSEPVEPAFTQVKVFDSNGKQVDDGVTKVDPADPTHVQVGLSSIGDGVYTVSWRALSTVDGHVTLGSFPFAVGTFDQAALDAASAASSQTSGSNPGEVLPRWLSLLGAAMALGGFFFVGYVWKPIWRETEAAGEAGDVDPAVPFQALQRGGVALFLAASIAALIYQAGSATGLPAFQTLIDPSLGDLLFATRYGLLWLGRIVCALALLLTEERWERVLRFVRPVAALGLLLTLSLNSHSAAAPHPLLPVFSDWLHLLAGAVWIGGLVYFAAGMYATQKLAPGTRTRLAAGLVPRFSNLGITTVALLGLTGLYNAWITVGSLDNVFNTTYGNALLLKIWIIVPLIGLAGVNLLVLRPALQAQREAGVGAGQRSLARHLALTVTGEMTLGATVLLAAASFATVPPARTLVGQMNFKDQADDLHVDLTITPGNVGSNQFDVNLTDSSGAPLDDASEVLLRFSLISGDVPVGTEASLTNQGQGLYSTQGTYFSLPGDWQTLVVIRRASKFDSFATFRMTVAAPGAAPAGGASAQAAVFARAAAILLYLAGILFVFALRGLTATRAQQTVLGILPAVALVIVGIGVFRTAQSRVPNTRVNPIPPTADSLAKGKAIFQQNCMPCHGPAGLGDGPAGLLLNPRPANLQQHMIPGVHTDGQIFDWITGGYPGSAMPAFGDKLTEEDRWNLLNYIRTLVPGS
jgi:copper transport protein